MSRIRTTVVVEIRDTFNQETLRDDPPTAAEFAELAAECERVGIPEDTTIKRSHYRFEAPLETTSLVISPALTPPPGILAAERGRVDVSLPGELPVWRAAKRSFSNPLIVQVLSAGSGIYEQTSQTKIIDSFVKDES